MAQTINVDSKPALFMPTLYYSQGDVGRTFEIVASSSDGFTIPSGATCQMVATKPSGLGFTVAGTVSGNKVTFTTTAVMTDEWGRFPAELRITSGNTVIGTANFYMEGERNPHPDGTTDGQQEQLIPELTLLVERAENAAQTATDDAIEAASATIDEVLNYLPTEVTNLKSTINETENYLDIFTPNRNILDYSTLSAGYIVNGTTIGAAGATTKEVVSDYIPVIPGHSYHMHAESTAGAMWVGYHEYKADTSPVGSRQVPSTQTSGSLSYVDTTVSPINGQTRFIRFSYRSYGIVDCAYIKDVTFENRSVDDRFNSVDYLARSGKKKFETIDFVNGSYWNGDIYASATTIANLDLYPVYKGDVLNIHMGSLRIFAALVTYSGGTATQTNLRDYNTISTDQTITISADGFLSLGLRNANSSIAVSPSDYDATITVNGEFLTAFNDYVKSDSDQTLEARWAPVMQEIVLLGDSIVQGVGSSDYSATGDTIATIGGTTFKRNVGTKSWGAKFKAKLESEYYPFSVINNGLAGQGIDIITANLDSLVSANTKMAIVCLGVNNRQNGAGTIQTYYEQLFNALKNKGITVWALSPIDSNGASGNTSLALINTACERACVACGVPYYNLYGEFNAVLNANTKADYYNDTLHPNDKGYATMYGLICKLLNF